MKEILLLLTLVGSVGCDSIHYEDNKGNKVDISTKKKSTTEGSGSDTDTTSEKKTDRYSFSAEPEGCVAKESRTFARENELLHFLTATCDRGLQVYGWKTDWQGNALAEHELLSECAGGVTRFGVDSNNAGFLLAYGCEGETTLRARQVLPELTAGPEEAVLTLRWAPRTLAVAWNPDADAYLVLSEGKGVLVNENAQPSLDGGIRLQDETATTADVAVLNGKWMVLQSKGEHALTCSSIDSLGVVEVDSPITLHSEGTSMSDSPALLAGSRAIQHSAYTKGVRVSEVSSDCSTKTGSLFNLHTFDSIVGTAQFDTRHLVSLVKKDDQVYASKVRVVGVAEFLAKVPVGTVQTSAHIQVAQGKVVINIDRKVTILEDL